LTGRTDKERVLYTKSVVDLLETKFYGIMDNEDEMCLSEDAEQTQMEEDVRSIETCKGGRADIIQASTILVQMSS
jgi:hypothetical protein